jgi:hypothetical protein
MGDMLKLIWWAVIGLFRSRASLEAEILTLRHQLNVLRRKSPQRLVETEPEPFANSSLSVAVRSKQERTRSEHTAMVM